MTIQLSYLQTHPKTVACFHWRFGFVERLQYQLFINRTAWLVSSYYTMYKFTAGVTRCKLRSNSNYSMCNIWIPMWWLHIPLFWHFAWVTERKCYDSLRKGSICSADHSSIVARSTKSICGWHGNEDFWSLRNMLGCWEQASIASIHPEEDLVIIPCRE